MIGLNNILKQQIRENLNKQFSKKQYVNIILMNGEELLLLKRSSHESTHPSFWCLPGGGKDNIETIKTGAIRETFEETGLRKSDYNILGDPYKVEFPDCVVYYHLATVKPTSKDNIILDEKEHQKYGWFTSEQWLQMDLILDLKTHLQLIFNIK